MVWPSDGKNPPTLHSVKAGRPSPDQHQPLKTWQLETWRIWKAYVWMFKIRNLLHITVSRNEKGKWQFFYLAFLSTDHSIRQSKLHYHMITNRHYHQYHKHNTICWIYQDTTVFIHHHTLHCKNQLKVLHQLSIKSTLRHILFKTCRMFPDKTQCMVKVKQ